MIGLDDMRQITGVIVEALGDNYEGLTIGMQLVYQGKTDRCLPDLDHREKELFGDFIFTYTYNHWADEDTNIDLFKLLIVPHLVATKLRLNLLDDHPAVVMLDVWPVQKTSSFRDRVKAEWPWIILLYIYAGGTGRSQKFDVDGANVMKPKLAQQQGVAFTLQLRDGVKPEDIRLDLTLSTLKIQQLYWLGEVYQEFKKNVPARTAGWVKTRVPLAFTPEWQRRALEWKADGKLWPGNSVDVVPEGEELEPSPTEDDLQVSGQFTDGQAALADLVAEDARCRGTFEALGGAAVEDAKKAKKVGISAEDLEYELEDMTPETVCVCLAATQDEFCFRLKVGKFVSPPLHLLHVLDVDVDAAGRSAVKAWCKFFNDEFVYCWELDEGDFPGSIPKDFQPTVVANLSAIMKAQRKGKTTAVGPAVAAGAMVGGAEAGPSAVG
ncbi:hypothetical protein CYMTET_16842 [Cymbomonas tetramitiformis]|uniref:Uncharacterized protein n=1 Tax=Cymbomonas tetramitiformis TaxID=36881 RepID=A0AAE0GBL4_9CHLO|nr:hypothetical protein CYMTET_16842 [Cymbomonas tetramitiformis]